MKNVEKKILVVSIMLAAPALREVTMMLAVAGLALAFTARSLEREPAYARVRTAKRKVQRRF